MVARSVLYNSVYGERGRRRDIGVHAYTHTSYGVARANFYGAIV